MKELTATYNKDVVFSGSDVTAFILAKSKNLVDPANSLNNTYGSTFIPFKNLGALSYSIHRDKMPVRKLGSAIAHSYTSGTRTIAGSIIVINFDRAAFFSLLSEEAADNISSLYGFSLGSESYSSKENKTTDQIPPFDILLLFSEEVKGAKFPNRGTSTEAWTDAPGSRLLLKNIRLVDEGMVTGTDEAYLETTFQYVAEDIEYLKPIKVPQPALPPPEITDILSSQAIPYLPPSKAQRLGESADYQKAFYLENETGTEIHKSTELAILDPLPPHLFDAPQSAYLLHDGTAETISLNIASLFPFDYVKDVVISRAVPPNGTTFVQPLAEQLQIIGSGCNESIEGHTSLLYCDGGAKDHDDEATGHWIEVEQDTINLTDTLYTDDVDKILDIRNTYRSIGQQISDLSTPLKGWSASSATSTVNTFAPKTFKKKYAVKPYEREVYYYTDVDNNSSPVDLGLKLSNLDTSAKRKQGVIQYNPLQYSDSHKLMLSNAVYSAVGDPASTDVTLSHAQRYFPFWNGVGERPLGFAYIAPSDKYTLNQNGGTLWNTIIFDAEYVPWRKVTETTTIPVTVPAKVKETTAPIVKAYHTDTTKFTAFAALHDAWDNADAESNLWINMNTMAALKFSEPIIVDDYLTPHSLTASDIPGDTIPTLPSDDPQYPYISYDVATIDISNNDYDTMDMTGYMNSIATDLNGGVKLDLTGTTIAGIEWDDNPYIHTLDSTNADVILEGSSINAFYLWWQEAFPSASPSKISATLDDIDLVDITSEVDFIYPDGLVSLLKKPDALDGFVYKFTYDSSLGGSGVVATTQFDLTEMSVDTLGFPNDQIKDRILDIYLMPKSLFEQLDGEVHPPNWNIEATATKSLWYPDPLPPAASGNLYQYKLEEGIHYNITQTLPHCNDTLLILENNAIAGLEFENPKLFSVDLGKDKAVLIAGDLSVPAGAVYTATNSFWYLEGTNQGEYIGDIDDILINEWEPSKSKDRFHPADVKATDTQDWSTKLIEYEHDLDYNTFKGVDIVFTDEKWPDLNSVFWDTTNTLVENFKINIPDQADPDKDLLEIVIMRGDIDKISRTIPRKTSLPTPPEDGFVWNATNKTITVKGESLIHSNSPLEIDSSAGTAHEILWTAEKVDPDEIDGYNSASIVGSVFEIVSVQIEDYNAAFLQVIVEDYDIPTTEIDPGFPATLQTLLVADAGFSISNQMSPLNRGADGQGGFFPIDILPKTTNSVHFPSFATEDEQPIKSVFVSIDDSNTWKEVLHDSEDVGSAGWDWDNTESDTLSIPFESIFQTLPITAEITPGATTNLYHGVSTVGIGIDLTPTTYFSKITKITLSDLQSQTPDLVMVAADNLAVHPDTPPSWMEEVEPSVFRDGDPEWFLDSNNEYAYKSFSGEDIFILSQGGQLANDASSFPHNSDGKIIIVSETINENTTILVEKSDLPYKAVLPNQAFHKLVLNLVDTDPYSGTTSFDSTGGWNTNSSWVGDNLSIPFNSVIDPAIFGSFETTRNSLNNKKLNEVIPWFQYLTSVKIEETLLTYLKASDVGSAQDPFKDHTPRARYGSNSDTGVYGPIEHIRYSWKSGTFGEGIAVQKVDSRTSDASLIVSEPWLSAHPKPIIEVYVLRASDTTDSVFELFDWEILDDSDWTMAGLGTERTITISSPEKLQYPVLNYNISANQFQEGSYVLEKDKSDNVYSSISELPGIIVSDFTDQLQSIKVNGVNILSDGSWTKIDPLTYLSISYAPGIGQCYEGWGTYAADIAFWGGVNLAINILEGAENGPGEGSGLSGFSSIVNVSIDGVVIPSEKYNIVGDFINVDLEVLEEGGGSWQVRYTAEYKYALSESADLVIYNPGRIAGIPNNYTIEIDYLTTGKLSYRWSAAGYYTYDDSNSKLQVLGAGDPNFPAIGSLSSWDYDRQIDVEWGHADVKTELNIWYFATGVWWWDQYGEKSADKKLWIYNSPGGSSANQYDEISIEYETEGGDASFYVTYSSRGWYDDLDASDKMTVYHPNGVMEAWNDPPLNTSPKITVDYTPSTINYRDIVMYYSSAGLIESSGTYNPDPQNLSNETLTFFRPSDLSTPTPVTTIAVDYSINMSDQAIVVHYSGKGYYLLKEEPDSSNLIIFNPGAPNSYLLSGEIIPESPTSVKGKFAYNRNAFIVPYMTSAFPLMKAFDAAATGTFTPSTLTLKDSEGVDVGGFVDFEYWNMEGEDPTAMTSFEITDVGTDATVTGLKLGPGVVLIDWTKGEEQYITTTGDPNPSWAPDIISKNEHTLEGSIRQVAPLNLNFKYTTLVPGFPKKILMEAATQATGVQGVPSPLNTFTISDSFVGVFTTGLPWNTASFPTLNETGLSKLFATPEEFPNWKIRRDYPTDKETVSGFSAGLGLACNEDVASHTTKALCDAGAVDHSDGLVGHWKYKSYTTFSGLPEGNNVDAQLIRPNEGITINTITQDTWTNQNSDEAIIRFSNFPIRLQPDDQSDAYDPITVEQQTWKPVPISYDYYIFEPILYRIDYLLENNWSRWKGKITDPGTGYTITDLRIFTDVDYDASVPRTGDLENDIDTREKNMLNITFQGPISGSLVGDSWDNGLTLAGTDGYIIIHSQCDGIVDAGASDTGAVITDQILATTKQVYAEWSEYPPAKDYTQGGWVVGEVAVDKSGKVYEVDVEGVWMNGKYMTYWDLEEYGFIKKYRWYVVKESRDSTGLRNVKEGGIFSTAPAAQIAAQQYITLSNGQVKIQQLIGN